VILKEYITNVFLRDVDTTRTSLDLGEFPVVLLCDDCSSHIDDEIKQIQASHNVRLLTFRLHSSNLFQPLDLVTFCAFTREKCQVSVKLPKGSQIWQITQIIKALEHATDSTDNRVAFTRAW
jgi:hypothetical protein